MKILLVDDEEALRNLIKEVLEEDLQAEVIAVANAAEALQELAATALTAQFDAVVTDNDMPGMKGSELASKVKQFSPQIRVVLMSGREIDKGSADIFIPKGSRQTPYQIVEFLKS
ncbi:MAG: response regulator [Candidatus Yanofskybacteria bacterium]|nr:response regulator [Candidatus Yanofskybacteria bacterium]